MKNLFSCSLLVFSTLLCQTIVAQTVPQSMNYQAVARDLNGYPLSNRSIALKINILEGSSEGKTAYSEVHSVMTDERGLFVLAVGKGKPQTGQFSKIHWSTTEMWIQLSIDEKGGNNFHVLSASQLLAVPYAFHAGSAESINIKSVDEKSGCSSTGIPFWTNLGNNNVNDICHFIGTTTAVDLVFKTNNNERMRITKEGTLQVLGDANIAGNNLRVTNDSVSVRHQLFVNEDANITQNLTVGSNADVASNLHVTSNLVSVDHQFLVSEDANIVQDLTIGGDLKIDGRLGIADNLVVTDDTVLVQHQFVVREDAFINGSLSVNGNNHFINGMLQTKCITILGGCDWYELSQSSDGIQPGEVAVINSTGCINSVQRSTRAYDPLVTGVVSGAGGINPGLGLAQEGVLEGNTKIALGGKVMVRVVGNVEPGNLLTSSNIQGCAMAVKNRRKAFGAVIGKALSVPNEEGLVLMQVMMR